MSWSGCAAHAELGRLARRASVVVPGDATPSPEELAELAELRADLARARQAMDEFIASREAAPAEFAAGGQRLRDGWRQLVIPENTVDLFQAYTALVLEPLGVAVDWVDSWYYHVRFGCIHCGTNVLRRADPSLVPWWRR
jgi:hypothetical protein